MKPSKIDLVTAKKAWWVPSSFLYVMLFGTAYCCDEKQVERFNSTEDNCDRVHETIHVRQAVSTGNSWLKYYWKYFTEWVCNLPLISVKWHAIYKFMSMELEAYAFEVEPSYVAHNECTGWKAIDEELPMSERKEIARDWYYGFDPETGSRWPVEMSFTSFIRMKLGIK